jgi:hypothetical protein
VRRHGSRSPTFGAASYAAAAITEVEDGNGERSGKKKDTRRP